MTGNRALAADAVPSATCASCRMDASGTHLERDPAYLLARSTCRTGCYPYHRHRSPARSSRQELWLLLMTPDPKGSSSSCTRQMLLSRPALSFGTASLAAFAVARAVMLASSLLCVYTYFETKDDTDQSLWAASLIVLMIRLTPIYLVGIMCGLICMKRTHDNVPSARIGVWSNGCALVAMNLVPLASYCLHLIGR